MTTRNKILLTILIALLLILGTLVALIVFAARGRDADDTSDAKEETTATKEEKEDDEDDEGDSSDDPTKVPEEFIGNYEGQIKWPPGADGENTKIGVTFTENSATLTTGRGSRALRVDVDEKQTNKKRIYSEAVQLKHGPENVTWTFIPTDDGMDVSYTMQGASRTDAHLTSTN
ncbi:hypothetical protein M3A74_07765 [Corynebacterium appendicis]|uniref:hypothetical protein n=1 Tax=Corynebacterium appendicis TaxID=163202 RepID=UPI00223BCC7D|nr:hypothetical protein [Corynebacterium appendicis]MCT1684699.1 hypothetical protein [Corynebacterium appendicis]